MSTTDEPSPDTPSLDIEDRPRFPRWLKWGLLGALGVLIVGYGLILFYANVIKDSPDELDASDLDAALATDEPPVPPTASTTSPSDPTDTAGAATADTAPDDTAPADTAPDDVAPVTDPPAASSGTWVATDGSELGYRVTENLFGIDTEGVGRTNEIEGSITIDGTQVSEGEFVVDVATITSDESRRDGQFRGRIMSTDEFPEATFVLTEPIELGTEPVEGAEVTTTATGDLTLRGVTNPVTFDVEARLQNGRIGVLGNIPVVFSDYGVPNPSTAGITTEDNGLLEFVLVFEPA